MGEGIPKTCRAVFKRQAIKPVINCCISLVLIHLNNDCDVISSSVLYSYSINRPSIPGRCTEVSPFQSLYLDSWGPFNFLYNGTLSVTVRRAGRKSDHSHLSTTEVKNDSRYTSTPPIRLNFRYELQHTYKSIIIHSHNTIK